MSRLVKRGRYWYAEYFDRTKGFTTRVSTGTDDRREAEQQLGAILTRAYDPKNVSIRQINVDALVAKFYTEVGKSLPSKYVYKSALDHVLEEIPGRSLEWFDTAHQEQFVSKLRAKGLADGTIQRIMSVVSRSVSWSHKRGIIRERPYIMTVPCTSTRDRLMTDDEARALLQAASDENERRLCLLLLTTGSRPQALAEAFTAQFDRQSRLIHLNPEGREQNPKKHRPIIPMTQAVYDASGSWKAGPVFMVQTDHPLSRGTVRQVGSLKYIWSRLHQKAGLPEDVTMYTVRHTVATELRRQGVSEWDVSGYLGHKAPGSTVTSRYAHWRPDYMRAPAEAMDRYWGRLGGLGGENRVASIGTETGVSEQA